MKPVVTIGDAIVDVVETVDAAKSYPGGAALNLAVGLARLGLPSIIAARVGLDQAGFRLTRYLREEDVTLINTPNADFTGVATSRRIDGEPSYSFNPAIFRRRIGFSGRLLQAIAEAPAVAVNSFAFAKTWQAEALREALSGARGLSILDPNVRPALVPDLNAFRLGFERAASRANMIKLSDEDSGLLYGRDDDVVAESFFEIGADVVLFTHGKSGASIRTRSGLSAIVPATRLERPIVDTRATPRSPVLSRSF